MSLLISVRYKLSCPKHPRYNPESGGEAAIKGGCEICAAMHAAWRKAQQMLEELYRLGEKIVGARRAAKE